MGKFKLTWVIKNPQLPSPPHATNQSPSTHSYHRDRRSKREPILFRHPFTRLCTCLTQSLHSPERPHPMPLSCREGGVRILGKERAAPRLPTYQPLEIRGSGSREGALGLSRHFQDEHCLPQPGMASLPSWVMSGHRLCVHHTTPLPSCVG